MLYPNDLNVKAKAANELLWLAKDSVAELEMAPLPGHERDTEAFLVAAIDPSSGLNFRDKFTPGKAMKLPEFFRMFASFAEQGEDAIIAHEIVK